MRRHGRGRRPERSVELDPTCQQGWRQIAVRCHFERDLNGLRMAAEQTDPAQSVERGRRLYGVTSGYAGDWEQAMSLVRRAIELNPQHLKALHLVVCTRPLPPWRVTRTP